MSDSESIVFVAAGESLSHSRAESPNYKDDVTADHAHCRYTDDGDLSIQFQPDGSIGGSIIFQPISSEAIVCGEDGRQLESSLSRHQACSTKPASEYDDQHLHLRAMRGISESRGRISEGESIASLQFTPISVDEFAGHESGLPLTTLKMSDHNIQRKTGSCQYTTLDPAAVTEGGVNSNFLNSSSCSVVFTPTVNVLSNSDNKMTVMSNIVNAGEPPVKSSDEGGKKPREANGTSENHDASSEFDMVLPFREKNRCDEDQVKDNFTNQDSLKGTKHLQRKKYKSSSNIKDDDTCEGVRETKKSITFPRIGDGDKFTPTTKGASLTRKASGNAKLKCSTDDTEPPGVKDLLRAEQVRLGLQLDTFSSTQKSLIPTTTPSNTIIKEQLVRQHLEDQVYNNDNYVDQSASVGSHTDVMKCDKLKGIIQNDSCVSPDLGKTNVFHNKLSTLTRSGHNKKREKCTVKNDTNHISTSQVAVIEQTSGRSKKLVGFAELDSQISTPVMPMEGHANSRSLISTASKPFNLKDSAFYSKLQSPRTIRAFKAQQLKELSELCDKVDSAIEMRDKIEKQRHETHGKLSKGGDSRKKRSGSHVENLAKRNGCRLEQTATPNYPQGILFSRAVRTAASNYTQTSQVNDHNDFRSDGVAILRNGEIMWDYDWENMHETENPFIRNKTKCVGAGGIPNTLYKSHAKYNHQKNRARSPSTHSDKYDNSLRHYSNNPLVASMSENEKVGKSGNQYTRKKNVRKGKRVVHVISPEGSFTQISQSPSLLVRKKGSSYSNNEYQALHDESVSSSNFSSMVYNEATDKPLKKRLSSRRKNKTNDLHYYCQEGDQRSLFSAACLRVAASAFGVIVWGVEHQKSDRGNVNKMINQKDNNEPSLSSTHVNSNKHDVKHSDPINIKNGAGKTDIHFIRPLYFFKAGGIKLTTQQALVLQGQLHRIENALVDARESEVGTGPSLEHRIEATVLNQLLKGEGHFSNIQTPSTDLKTLEDRVVGCVENEKSKLAVRAPPGARKTASRTSVLRKVFNLCLLVVKERSDERREQGNRLLYHSDLKYIKNVLASASIGLGRTMAMPIKGDGVSCGSATGVITFTDTAKEPHLSSTTPSIAVGVEMFAKFGHISSLGCRDNPLKFALLCNFASSCVLPVLMQTFSTSSGPVSFLPERASSQSSLPYPLYESYEFGIFCNIILEHKSFAISRIAADTEHGCVDDCFNISYGDNENFIPTNSVIQEYIEALR